MVANLQTWTLRDRDWNVVAQLTILEDELPDVIVYKRRTFYYDQPNGQFLETTPMVVE